MHIAEFEEGQMTNVSFFVGRDLEALSSSLLFSKQQRAALATLPEKPDLQSLDPLGIQGQKFYI